MGAPYNPDAPRAPIGPNEVESILKEARKPSRLAGEAASSIEVWAVPDGYHIERVDQIDEAFTAPHRAKNSVKLDTLDSYIEYTNTFKQSEDVVTRVYCQADFVRANVTLTTVFNDHVGQSDAGYRDFRATYQPKPSQEWLIWAGSHAKPMSQVDFATFIENNMRDIASVAGYPTGSEMLEMALNLEVTQDASFRSAVRLQSGGVALEYVAKEDDQTKRRMEVFGRFAIGIPPFFGGAAYQVDAKLRYRLQGSAVTFWYELVRPDLVVADAVKADIAKVKDETQVAVLMGTP